MIIVLAALTTGCQHAVQTTSGRQYLQGYQQLPETLTDQAVMDAAKIEPNLKFPARIGLIRIAHGQVTPIPPEEAEAWITLTETLGSDFGEFMPVSRMIAAMAAGDQPRRSHDYEDHLKGLIRNIRLGSARQHLDAVLMYEVCGTAEAHLNPAAVANLTLLGGYLAPGKTLKIKGLAQALLLDVRNGYPYGTALATVEDRGYVPAFGSRERQATRTEQAQISAALKLIPEVDQMMRKLRRELSRAPAQSAQR